MSDEHFFSETTKNLAKTFKGNTKLGGLAVYYAYKQCKKCSVLQKTQRKAAILSP